MSTSRAVLVSGGLDSVMCAEKYRDANRLFFDYGQKYLAGERKACRSIWGHRLHEVKIRPRLALMDGYFVPARNLLLASFAAQSYHEIVMGGMADDHCEDKTDAEFHAMSEMLTRHCRGTRLVTSPFWHRAKVEAVAEYLTDGGKKSTLLKTFSCYAGMPRHCNDCAACLRRSIALRANDIDVPVPGRKIVTEYMAKLHEYEPARVWSLLKAIGDCVEVDIDGVLTLDTGGHDYLSRRPRRPVIDRVRAMHDRGKWIILNTSRMELDRAITVEWLSRNKIPYHALLMNKPPVMLVLNDLAEAP